MIYCGNCERISRGHGQKNCACQAKPELESSQDRPSVVGKIDGPVNNRQRTFCKSTPLSLTGCSPSAKPGILVDLEVKIDFSKKVDFYSTVSNPFTVP
jgi:hypothetical protein